MGIEEQFAQISIGSAGLKQDESGFVVLSSPTPMLATIVSPAIPLPVSSSAIGVDYTAASWVISDDERSDHGVPIGYRKQPPPQ